MSSCEKCWRESGGDPDRYKELLSINNCTLEEQAGSEDARVCPVCKRKTVHMWTKECLNCKKDGEK